MICIKEEMLKQKREYRHMNKDSFSFVIYMIHACANRWHMSPAQVYKILQQADCINSFLVSNYEILHTQSTGFIVEDIQEYLKNREVAV